MADSDLKEKSGSERSEPSEGYRTSAHSPADTHAAGGGKHQGAVSQPMLDEDATWSEPSEGYRTSAHSPADTEAAGGGKHQGALSQPMLDETPHKRQPSPTQDGIHDEKSFIAEYI